MRIVSYKANQVSHVGNDIPLKDDLPIYVCKVGTTLRLAQRAHSNNEEITYLDEIFNYSPSIECLSDPFEEGCEVHLYTVKYIVSEKQMLKFLTSGIIPNRKQC